MSDEYAIDPARFAVALREQRAMRMKGGMYHLTQVSMAFNTNKIEGSSLDEEQTRYLYEARTIIGDVVPVDDVVETTNSFALLEDWFAVGDWKRLANVVGDGPTTAPEQVGLAIDDLLSGTAAPGSMSFEGIVDSHYRFGRFHPFQDGNGRVGRIVLFQQCLQNGIMPFVVLDSHKEFYYRGLAEYENEPGYLRDTFRLFPRSLLPAVR